MFNHYLTVAFNHFRAHKLTTSVNVVCLTIGLVCFLSIYASIEYLRSGERHFPNADRTYMITWQADGSPIAAFGPWRAATQIKADIPELEFVARSTFDSGFDSEIPISAGDRKSFLHVAYADAELLDIFSLPFLAGDSKNALRANRSAVLSKNAAIRFFGDAPSALGKVVRLQDGRELNVHGIVDDLKQPSQFSTSGDNVAGAVRFDILISMDVLEEEARAGGGKQEMLRNWMSPYVFTYVALPRDGSLSLDALRSRLVDLGALHASNQDHQIKFGAWPVGHLWLNSMGAFMGTHKTGIPVSLLFYVLGAIVLSISCLNYANLATAQAAKRAKEIGMRRIVGATRGQIMSQFLFEASLVTLIALIAALSLVGFALMGGLPGASSVAATILASTQFWVTLAVLLLGVTLAAGLYPAFVLSNVRPLQAVRSGKVRSGGRLMPKLLVGIQFGGASFLIISMFVMIAQNAEFKRSVLRVATDPLVVVSNNARSAGVDFDLLQAELLRQPHIKSVTGYVVSPWSMMAPPARVTTSLASDATVVNPTQSFVNHDFFATLDINVLAGRAFDRQHASDVSESRNETQIPNAVVDRALAAQNGWSNPNDALGKVLYAAPLGRSRSEALPWTVIGVVEDRPMSVVNVSGAPSNLYVLAPKVAASPIVRVSSEDPSAGLKEIESVWNRLAPSVALQTRFADESLQRSYRAIEGVTVMFAAIASLALIISILGLIGMSIHVIGRREHEIGVRKTLGASVKNIVGLLLVDFSKPVIVANLLAWPLAFVAMQLYLSVFTQRTSLNALPFAAGLLFTVAIAWIAVSAQATRAARLSPATVLRNE